MDYQAILQDLRDNQYLISMTPAHRLVELGFNAGMDNCASILDLCCGYGRMLSLWHEAFGICGVGVDRSDSFIRVGREQMSAKGITGVELICADVTQWHTEAKFDFACLSGEDFGGFSGTIRLLETYLKPGGKLIIGTRYSKTEEPPQALIDFEGETFSLLQMHRTARENGWYITGMATDTPAEWERYIMWSARRNLASIRCKPEDENLRRWADTWYETYFTFRRQYEGYVTLLLEKL